MLNTKISLLLFFLLFSVKILNAQYVWTQKANYGGGAIYDAFGFVIGNKAYVGTGIDTALNYHDDFWEWDQATNTWTQKNNFPGAGRYGSRAFVINNKGYVMSGLSNVAGFLTDLWEYDPTLNSWLQKANCPGAARYNVTAFSIGGTGYFGLGSIYGNTFFNDFWKYDPLANSWAQITSFPGTHRGAASDFVINGEAYVGTGSNTTTGNTNDFYKYNPGTNLWTQIDSLPGSPRNAAFSFSINNKGYLTQGYDFTVGLPQTIYGDMWEYDPSINQWMQLSNFPGKAHYEGIHFSIGNKGYIGLGGDTTWGVHFMNDFWEYGPVTGINENHLSSDEIKVYASHKNVLKIEFLKPFNKNLELKIYNVDGKIIRRENLNPGSYFFEITLDDKSNGIYFYKISSEDLVVKSGKIILH